MWLEPVAVEYNRGYGQPDLNKIVRLTRLHRSKLLETWNAHFTV